MSVSDDSTSEAPVGLFLLSVVSVGFLFMSSGLFMDLAPLF